ncbi:MAG TPA: AraC family transcriptional regulator [Candidatus Eisenbergiella merdipullorum]|uniref:AraC family transcriptional regulator n=1 Tax=Candidatus Eisenbergiella merdipullorum TaxID=2838553 RepID=A0A9D2I374_9FIRM|nr:AraC family transcriptional regulator [Candidatus Eisenbergiella merdipullorum]
MKKNPFKFTIFSLAVICCVIVSITFCYINYISITQTRKQNDQKKLELCKNDLEIQLQLLENLALKISITKEYQPYYLQENRYHEMVMLEQLKQYEDYSMLTSDFFLYYGGDTFFHSSGFSMSEEAYTAPLSQEERATLANALQEETDGISFLPAENSIYVIMPLRSARSGDGISPKICFSVRKSDLEERFQIVSGGINGILSLYMGGNLLYSDQPEACVPGGKRVITTDLLTGQGSLCYLPEKEGYFFDGLFPFQVMLILTDVLLVLIIAELFARHSYIPFLRISEKYRRKISLPEEISCQNALEELDYMMDNVLRNNREAAIQIEQKQKMLRKQVLHMLLEGNYSGDISSYLNQLQIRLNGPYFYVITMFFEQEEAVLKSFLTAAVEELGQDTEAVEGAYLYAIGNEADKQINVICSLSDLDRKADLDDYVCEQAEGYACEPVIGIGNAYRSLSSLSASWLESTDSIHKKRAERSSNDPKRDFIYEPEGLYQISAALASGDEGEALNHFSHYVQQMENGGMSLMMQQYIFADFLSEITRLARKYRIELPRQYISLIVSAKNVQDFKDVVQNLIHDFCEKRQLMKKQKKDDEAYQAFKYVKEHFSEYDLSIEKVADHLDMTTAAVRQAVYKYSGKMYKDYLIYLRIEYAKQLLGEDNLTVEETCQKVGYNSVSYFTKLFKKMVGVSPSKYKKGNGVFFPGKSCNC